MPLKVLLSLNAFNVPCSDKKKKKKKKKEIKHDILHFCLNDILRCQGKWGGGGGGVVLTTALSC